MRTTATALPLPQFHHHPDGTIYIRTKGAEYADSLANFLLDVGSGNAPEPLPAGADERLYIQRVSHALLNRQGLVDGGPMPWQYGDVAISLVEKIIAKQAQRRAQ